MVILAMHFYPGLLLRVLGKHADAGYYLGELIMTNRWSNEVDPSAALAVAAKIAAAVAQESAAAKAGAGAEGSGSVAGAKSTVAAAAEALLAQLKGSITDAFNFYMQSVQKGHPHLAIHRCIQLGQ